MSSTAASALEAQFRMPSSRPGRRSARSLRVIAFVVVLAAAVPPSAIAWPWQNEDELRTEPNLFHRETYVLDPGQGHTIAPQVFVSEPYKSFYLDKGFDRNFLTWAPQTTINPSGGEWTACKHEPRQVTFPLPLCSDEAIVYPPPPFYPEGSIRHDIPNGPLTVRLAGDSWINLACGNWSPANEAPKTGGPIPRITGTKYEDRNGNGVRDPGEPGLSGWTTNLFYNGAFVTSTKTNPDGTYTLSLDANRFPDLREGTYSVTEAQQPGWVAAQAPSPIFVPLGVGSHTYVGFDFGNYRPASITGRKFEDMNADGAGVGDPGLVGWMINYSGPVSGSVVSAFDGTYTIGGLRPGTYTVSEEFPPGWHQSLPGGSYTVTVESGDSVSGRDFGNWLPASISGRKFDDGNVDGSGAGDPGLSGWAVALDTGAATLTAEAGTFSFVDLKPGTYTISEQLLAGWRQTAPPGGSHTVTVTSGQRLDGIEFGNVCLGSARIRLFDDSGASSLASVPVRIDQVSVPGILANTPALPRSATGPTTFDELLPGSYRVTVSVPDGIFTTDPDLTVVNGKFAVTKTVSVFECRATTLDVHLFTSSSGKVTGGVRIAVPRGFATAGFEFQTRIGMAQGTLEYQDHALGLNLHTDVIDAITVNSAGTVAFVWGKVVLSGQTERFVLRLVDAGEPGTSDQFWLRTSGGYSAGEAETLQGGNVQIHRR